MICEKCGKEMTITDRRWGKEGYYGQLEHVNYACECGHAFEHVHDVPEPLLPWSDYGDDEPDEWQLLEQAAQDCGLTEDDDWCRWAGSDDCDVCPFRHRYLDKMK